MVNRWTNRLMVSTVLGCLLGIAAPVYAASPVANRHAPGSFVRPADIGVRTRFGYQAMALPGRPWYGAYHASPALGPRWRGDNGYRHRYYDGCYGSPITPWTCYGYGVAYLSYPSWYYWNAPYTFVPPAPMMLPAGDLFGPIAARQPLGGAARQPAGGAGNGRGGLPVRPIGRGVQHSNATARGRAWRLVEQGDARFAKGDYIQARQRYRTAAAAAPDLGEPCFRQGHALTAQGLYTRAVAVYRRGLQHDSGWPQSGFRWHQIYGDDQATEKAHRDALVAQVAEQPHNTDLLFLLGIRLYFDGQVDQARLFFRRAKQLGGDLPELDAFLAEPVAAPAVAAGQEF